MPSTDIAVAQTLDTRGTLCPLPVIKARQTIDKMASGEVLKLIASDPGAKADIPSWTRMTGNALLHSEFQDGTYAFWIKKT